MEPYDDVQDVLNRLSDQPWPPEKHTVPRQQLVVRGLYRYEHAGFGGAFYPGEFVSLERERGNQYDSNAVKVILSDGKMLGYIAKEMAATLAHEIDEGMKYVVWIANDPFREDKWGQCKLDVLLKVSTQDLASLEIISSFDPDSVKRYSLGYDVADVYWSKSPLEDAVRMNDVAKARKLIFQGQDVDQMTVGLSGHIGHALSFHSSPLLMMVRSVEMYKLFVEAGAQLHPRSYLCAACKVFGKEHNLLETLWRGPKMDAAALELADYLVFTEYDLSLRNKIDEIRKLCADSGKVCPYAQNIEYVLEWCDMEKRAVDVAVEIMKREYSGPYSLGHDLMHFISVWGSDGYDKALEWYRCDLSEDEIPRRYVYPERILNRKY